MLKAVPRLALALAAQIALALILTGLGYYHALSGCLILATFICLAGCLFVERATTAHPPKLAAALTGGIGAVIISLSLYGIPAERFFGRDDQGTYSNIAVHLARTGQYRVSSPALATLAPDNQGTFLLHQPAGAFNVKKDSSLLWHHHIGYLTKGDRIIPVFPPLYPVFISGGYFVAGWPALEWQGYLFLIITAVLFGIFISRVWGTNEGLAMMFLWMFFPLCLWFSRTFYAENLLVSLWALILCLMVLPPDKWLYLAIGLLAGLSPLVKIDALLMVSGIGVYGGYLKPPFRRPILTGLAAGLLITLLWFIMGNGSEYFTDIINNIGPRKLLCAAALTGLILLISTRSSLRGTFSRILSRPWLYRIGAGIFLLLACYAYFIRPYTTDPHKFYYAAVQAVVESGREQTFPRLAWYLTTPGLWLAVGGITLLILDIRRSRAVTLLFVITGIVTLVFFCYELRNAPVQPYGMRRMLVYAVPLLLAGFIYCSKKIHPILAIITAFALILGFTPLNNRLNTLRNFPDVRIQLDGLSRLFPPGAIILTSATEPGTFLVSPLQIIYGIDSFALNNPPRQDAKAWADYQGHLKNQIDIWKKQGRKIYFLTEDPASIIPDTLNAKPLFKTKIESKFYPQTADQPACPQEPWHYRFAVFK